MLDRLKTAMVTTLLILTTSGCYMNNQSMINFDQLTLSKQPNFCLAYRNLLTKNMKQRQLISPIFNQPLPILVETFHQFIRYQKRMKRLQQDLSNDHYQYMTHSALFHFPDLIDVQLIPISKHQSTLYLYSRSLYGYYDFGVNCRRLKYWLQEISLLIKNR